MRAFRRTATASALLFFGVWIGAITSVSAAPLAAGEPAEQTASNCGPLGCAPWAAGLFCAGFPGHDADHGAHAL